MDINEIIQQRKDKYEAFKAKGISCFGSASSSRQNIASVIEPFEEGKNVALAGRITAKRSHGKISFLDLRDGTARIQLYVKADFIGEEGKAVFDGVDIADFVEVQGSLFKTHTGEPTLKVEKVTILAKALRPLPEKWHGLKDVEARYRQRYLDLVSNEEIKQVFLLRSKMIKSIRDFLDNRSFLEVETPMMHSIPGGAAGRPFKTFHNEYGFELFMRIAPELYLKRLLVGGFDKVYEMNRNFRNEGVSIKHNPEFTMLEVYEAYSNSEGMMELAESLIVSVFKTLKGTTKITYQGKEIDLTTPWKRVSFAQLVKDRFSIVPEDPTEVMLEKLKVNGFARDAAKLSRTQIGKIIEDVLEQEMNMNPMFVTDYFASMSPLAQTKKDNPLISERFELYIAGMEIGNAYSELNNPIEQKNRFVEEVDELAKDEKKTVDEDYCIALEHGMPPAGGLGIGIDRLAMLLCDQASIREVILFPLLRNLE